jgi:hypothetical protein
MHQLVALVKTEQMKPVHSERFHQLVDRSNAPQVIVRVSGGVKVAKNS